MWVERPRPAFMQEVIIKRSYKEQLEFEQRAKDRTFYLEILNLGTRNVLEEIILCHGVCLVHCRMFNSIPSLYPPDTSGILQLGQPESLQILPNIPGNKRKERAMSRVLKNQTGLSLRLGCFICGHGLYLYPPKGCRFVVFSPE